MGIIKIVSDAILSFCDLKSIELNHKKGQSLEERKRDQETRKMISDIRSGLYLVGRVLR